MYKKITHSIVEEHYDHPLATKIKSGLNPTLTRKVRRDYDDEDLIFARPSTEIFKKDEFKTNLESYFSNYAQKLIEITDSVIGTEEQLVTPFEELFDSVDNIKNFFNPFYSRELGESLATTFRYLASSVTMVSHSVKAGFDPAPWIRALNGAANVGPLNNFNDRWIAYTYQNPIRQFNFDIVKRINAVKAGDRPSIDQATTEAITAMMAFKDVIYNGITQQFPKRFTA
jgi:hypothetical protein